MVIYEEQQHLQKRPRDEVLDKDERSLDKKRREVAISSNYPAAFWDTLSRVHLTRKALQELNRRSKQSDSKAAARRTANSRLRRLLRSDSRRLKALAKDGGADLSALRGYSEIPTVPGTMSKSDPQSRKRSHDSSTKKSSTSRKTGNTSPYDGDFQQKLEDRGIYSTTYRLPDGSRQPEPRNIEDIRNMLGRPCPSLSPSMFSETAFQDFEDANAKATAEAQVMANVVPLISGPHDGRYKSSGDRPFHNMKKFEASLTAPKPDKFYGASLSQISPRIRNDLGQYIIPSTDSSLPAAPNYFLAAKGASGRPDVAQRQAMYDGAVGARAMLELQNYGNAAPIYDGNAYTIMSVYQPVPGMLVMYAMHPSQPKDAGGEPQYYTTRLDGYWMGGNADGFSAGAAAYRNAREWTKQQRDGFIINANLVAQRGSTGTRSSSRHENGKNLSSLIEEQPSTSETSADELALDYNPVAKRQRRSASPQ